jgi:DNA-directed RNA polymerase beta subunit
MSNSETSSYDSFDSSVTDTLLTALRPKDSKDGLSAFREEITDDELKILGNFDDKNEFKDQNLRDLSWKIFDDYFSSPNRLTQHHLDSYNNFISYTIPRIVKDYNPIIVKANYSNTRNKYMDEYHITFGDVYVGKPGIKENDGRTKMMYPIEARWRNLTYSADLYVDVYQKSIKHQESATTPSIIKEYPPMKKVSLRTIPIMVKSAYCPLSADTGRSQSELGECEYDKGGYFIVKGSEKVLICQERKCENKILAFAHNKTQTAYSHTVEISSVPSVRSFIRSTQLKLYKKTGNGTVQVFIQRFKNDHPFPLFIVFRALGITSDRDIMERILYNTKAPRNKKAFNLLKPSIDEASAIQSQEMALLYMANYVSRLPEMKDGNETEEKFRQNYVTQLLKTELFPHVGEDFLKKAWFLGMMAKKLIDTALGVKKHDDRDSFLNKRISSSGPLMEDLFRNNFNKLVKDIIKATENDMRQGRTEEIHTTILKKIRASTIESSIRYSLGTGTWGMKSQASSSKKGIAQPLNRLSNSASVSHLRRVNAPRAEKGGRVTEPRKLHGTQWGRFCVVGTTLVLLPGGVFEYIRNLKDGDTVITVNPSTLKLESSTIYGWFQKKCYILLNIISTSGSAISCTPDHPFLVKVGSENVWKPAGTLKQNDLVGYLFNFKVIFITINTIVQAPGDDVFDFTTDSKNHSFIANGFVTHNCPSETPDGHMVGIVKNMALMAVITIGSDSEAILSILKEDIISAFKDKTNVNNVTNETKITPILDASPYQMDEQVRIFINGNPYGCTSTPATVIARLRALRRHGALDIYTSITWVVQEQEIRIHTEGGRNSRPVYIVRNNRLLITLKDFQDITQYEKGWNDLLLEGKIEYLDVQEEDTAMIATNYEDLLENKTDNPTFVNYTHCEIHPVMIFGAAACTIPFAENNQGIRIMYESAQKKQALSVYATNYRDRMDNPGQVLRFPQVPLITTKPSKYLNERELPSGQNAIVAIACFTGFNQEDSLIMNQGSIDRGIFTSMYYRTYKDSERKNQASLEEEKFCKPVKYNPNGTLRTAGTKAASYDLLDDNGFVKVGSYVKGGDVIIGKVVPLKNTTESGPKFKDASTTIGASSAGVVDWVYVNKDSDGYQFAKVRIRSKRVPGIGDKFSSRYGQKGTIGAVYAQEDMPFTADGITPDIIVNPAAIPSRMTIGQLLETVVGKAACTDGFECDATPFSSENVDTPDKLAEILQAAGFRKYGTQEMFNGRNGKKFRAKIFIGSTYYQRLKHMSKDKLHARATGPLQLLTRQPPEGRKRDGGFRFGEMERDSMLGYSCVGFLKEKMFDCSDKYSFWVCNICGTIAVANPTKNIFKCLSCKDSTDFSNVQCPYACKLFFQELQAMSIMPRIFTDNVEHNI